MSFKAVVFDLDGTLLNTLDDLADSMNNVLKRHSLPPHNLESFKYMIGEGVEALVKKALPKSMNDSETVKAFMSEYRAEYSSNWNNKTAPYEGIVELIDTLYSQGVKLAVLSNKPHDFTEICVREFLSFDKFDVIFGHRPDTVPKPDPAGAYEISGLLGIPPEQILYLGDTNVDMQTAVSAGMYPVGVLWGFRTRDELIKNGAKVVIETPDELLSLL